MQPDLGPGGRPRSAIRPADRRPPGCEKRDAYSEIVTHTTPVAEIAARRPKAVILSGGPASVYEPGAPRTDPALFEIGVPVFGICYGFQAMAQALGGEVARHRAHASSAVPSCKSAPVGRPVPWASGRNSRYG